MHHISQDELNEFKDLCIYFKNLSDKDVINIKHKEKSKRYRKLEEKITPEQFLAISLAVLLEDGIKKFGLEKTLESFPKFNPRENNVR